MPPLPEVFVKTAWGQVASEIDVPAQVKRQLLAEIVRQHNESLTAREAVRALARVLEGVDWRWPRCKALLQEEGEEPTTKAMLEVLVHWLTMAAHGLYRRGQIRAVLSDDDMGHVIMVGTLDGETASCGRVDGEILDPTPEVLKSIPPCKRLRCACEWFTSLKDI